MNMSRFTSLFFVLISMFVMAFLGPDAGAQSEPELKTDANILDCQSCHVALSALPKGHSDVKKESDCSACHQIDQVYKPEKHTSLRGKLSLMHLHGLNEVGCEDCHDSATEPKPVTTDGCLNCHESFETVVKRTEFLGHFNPHVSKHYGAEQACDICHFVHEKSENLCASCHDVYRPIP
jgi:hypothetical protein